MALHIFPDCGLRQGIKAQSVALAVEPYSRKFLLTKHGDNPMQRNTARAPDKFGIHESIWHNFSRRDGSLGNSADWTLTRHYYIATMSCRRTRGWELTPNSPEDQALVVRSQRKAWTAELELLLRDPRVQKFTELQEKIDEADAFIMERNAKPSVNRSAPFDPYDAYDAFEFAWDLTGQEVSSLEVSKLAHGRFPDLSNEGRRLMIHYLIDNGVAEVARKTASGQPTWYRFGSPRGMGNVGKRIGLGIPDNELSALKTEDLEDLAVRAAPVSAR